MNSDQNKDFSNVSLETLFPGKNSPYSSLYFRLKRGGITNLQELLDLGVEKTLTIHDIGKARVRYIHQVLLEKYQIEFIPKSHRLYPKYVDGDHVESLMDLSPLSSGIRKLTEHQLISIKMIDQLPDKVLEKILSKEELRAIRAAIKAHKPE